MAIFIIYITLHTCPSLTVGVVTQKVNFNIYIFSPLSIEKIMCLADWIKMTVDMMTDLKQDEEFAAFLPRILAKIL